MPPKRRTNNKKKNKAKGGAKNKAARSPEQVTLEGETPEKWKQWNHNDLQEEYTTVYSRYKRATNRFLEYMASRDPSPEDDEDGRRVSTRSLMAAADWMAGTSYAIDPSILRDLKLAIRIRSRVARSVYGGGDDGHKYFLEVLTYCWYVLKDLPRDDSVKPRGDEKTAAEATNPFAALTEEDDEDDEDDKDIFPVDPVPRPKEPSGSQESMSLDDLLKSDDRHDAHVFLLTLNLLLEAIRQQYRSILECFLRNRQMGLPDHAIVGKLMEAAVTANMAIQQVKQLEMDLMVHHEHLTTPYRVLVAVVLPELTQATMAIVREHATNKGCTEKDVIAYVGDCVESYLRNDSDPYNRKDQLVHEFCRKWRMDSMGKKKCKDYFKAMQQLVILEVPTWKEKHQHAQMRASIPDDSVLPGSHQWLKSMHCMGGNRAIDHTLRLLQTFGHVVRKTPQDQELRAYHGFFGRSPWTPGSNRTTQDLDELLMAEILPQWVLMCRKGIIGQIKLPREDELCPFFVLLRKYVVEPEKPVGWSIAFAIHALLVAALEVDPIFDDLVATSKSTFGVYFDQTKFAKKVNDEANPESIGDSNSPTGRLWIHNMVNVSYLQNLGLPIFGDRALWNPLCAGTTLSYLTYFGNIEAGCALIDCNAQLRITLHLFHALLVNGILSRGQITLLDQLYDSFRNSKAMWEGSRLPERGEFVQRFWICSGINDARRMADEARKAVSEARAENTPQQQSSSRGTRKLAPIKASEISKSYRRICLRDFHDVVDRYHTPEQRARNKGTEQYLFNIRTNDTLDAMSDEERLLALNWPSCAALIESFVNGLIRVLQWEPLLARITGGSQEHRQRAAFLFAQYLLGALDFADDPIGHKFMNVPLGEVSSEFMTEFFGRLKPENTLWFQPLTYESGTP